MEEPQRLFEYKDHWIARRRDRDRIYIHWRRPGTRQVRRHSTGTSDAEEARARLIAFADARTLPALVVPVRSNLPVPLSSPQPQTHANDSASPLAVLDILTAYIAKLVNQKGAQANGRSSLKQWIAFCKREDIVYVHELTRPVQERFVEWRRETGHSRLRDVISNATINGDLGILKAAFRYAWMRGLLASPPFVLGLRNPRGREDYLTADECRRLLRACTSKHLYRFVLIALHTLQRPKSIFQLRTSQINMAANRIDFMRPTDRETSKRRPVVPITPTLLPELAEANADSKSGFVVEYGNEPILDNVSRSFEQARRRAGIRPCTPYILRHTGATLLASMGVPMRMIAGMLGHTTERTTERYAKHAPEFLREAADALELLFGSVARLPAGEQCLPVCLPTAAGTFVQPLQLTPLTMSVSPWHVGFHGWQAFDLSRDSEAVDLNDGEREESSRSLEILERAKGFEPSTLTLAIWPQIVPKWARVFRRDPA